MTTPQREDLCHSLDVILLGCVLKKKSLVTFIYQWNCMKCRNPEEVIDIVLLRVLAFYLVIILETGTSILLLTRVKHTGRALDRIR